jgi:hypothetical protein
MVIRFCVKGEIILLSSVEKWAAGITAKFTHVEEAYAVYLYQFPA